MFVLFGSQNRHKATMTTGPSLYAPSRRPQWLYDALVHESARVLLEVQVPLKEKLTIDLPRPMFKHGRAPAVAQLHVQIEYVLFSDRFDLQLFIKFRGHGR